MIKLFAQRKAGALDLGKIGDESMWRTWRAAHSNFSLKRMAMHAAILMAARRSGETMRGIEAERVGNLDYLRGGVLPAR